MEPYNVLFLCTGNSARSIISLPIESLDRMALQERLEDVGRRR